MTAATSAGLRGLLLVAVAAAEHVPLSEMRATRTASHAQLLSDSIVVVTWAGVSVDQNSAGEHPPLWNSNNTTAGCGHRRVYCCRDVVIGGFAVVLCLAFLLPCLNTGGSGQPGPDPSTQLGRARKHSSLRVRLVLPARLSHCYWRMLNLSQLRKSL